MDVETLQKAGLRHMYRRKWSYLVNEEEATMFFSDESKEIFREEYEA